MKDYSNNLNSLLYPFIENTEYFNLFFFPVMNTSSYNWNGFSKKVIIKISSYVVTVVFLIVLSLSSDINRKRFKNFKEQDEFEESNIYLNTFLWLFLSIKIVFFLYILSIIYYYRKNITNCGSWTSLYYIIILFCTFLFLIFYCLFLSEYLNPKIEKNENGEYKSSGVSWWLVTFGIWVPFFIHYFLVIFFLLSPKKSWAGTITFPFSNMRFQEI